MKEFYGSEEEYNAAQEWRREQEGPSIKAGDTVRVPRTDGSIDDGWLVKFIYPHESGSMFASVINETKGLRKELSLEELKKFNR